MSYATGICWTIAEDLPAVKELDADHEIIEMSEDRWNSIAIPSCLGGDEYAHIVVGVGRYGSVKKFVRVQLPCTTRDLLTAIHDFYKRPMSEDEILEVEDDVFGHRNRCLERVRRGEIVKTSDLSGGYNREGLIHFEGVRSISCDIYGLCLGS